MRATTLVLASMLVAGPAVAAHRPCEGVPPDHLVSRLEALPIASQPATDRDALFTLLNRYGDELRAVLDARGVGQTADLLFAEAASHSAQERPLRHGESFEWMAVRTGGKVESVRPACMKSSEVVQAWEIPVEIPRAAPASSCALSVQRSASDPSIIEVAVSGAPADLAIWMRMNDGESEQILVDSGAAKVHDSDPASNSYSFAAVLRTSTKSDVYRFVVPASSLNLALAQVDEVSREIETTCAQAEIEAEPSLEPQRALDAAGEEQIREEAPSWRIHLTALTDLSVTGSSFTTTATAPANVRLDGELAGSLSVEQVVTRRLGVALGLLASRWKTAVENLSGVALTAGPNLHVAASPRAELVAGWFVGVGRLGGDPTRLGSGFVWGAHANAELLLPASCWFVLGQLRYTNYAVDRLTFDAVEAGAGVGLRF